MSYDFRNTQDADRIVAAIEKVGALVEKRVTPVINLCDRCAHSMESHAIDGCHATGCTACVSPKRIGDVPIRDAKPAMFGRDALLDRLAKAATEPPKSVIVPDDLPDDGCDDCGYPRGEPSLDDYNYRCGNYLAAVAANEHSEPPIAYNGPISAIPESAWDGTPSDGERWAYPLGGLGYSLRVFTSKVVWSSVWSPSWQRPWSLSADPYDLNHPAGAGWVRVPSPDTPAAAAEQPQDASDGAGGVTGGADGQESGTEPFRVCIFCGGSGRVIAGSAVGDCFHCSGTGTETLTPKTTTIRLIRNPDGTIIVKQGETTLDTLQPGQVETWVEVGR